MISKLYQRIVLLVVLVVLPFLVYLSKNMQMVDGKFQVLDTISHFPIILEDHDSPEIKDPQTQTHAQTQTDGFVETDECTIVNPLNRGFIDLRGLSSLGNEGKPIGWRAKGYDSGLNFTLGVCSTPMKKLHDKSEIADEVDSAQIGAFYIDPKTGLYVSLGEYSTTPIFRGRKLTLTYENGSYCNNLRDDNGNKVKKSTLITFTCDREMMSKAAVSYIGNSNDCNYMFEIRSHHVCPTAAKGNNLAAVWIFLIIIFATIGGYFSGGILYRKFKAPSKLNI